MKKISLLYIGLVLLSLTWACHEEEDGRMQYTVEPKTSVGTKLAEHTSLIATIFTDSAYTLTPGVEATELSYFSMKGYAMHMFVFEVDLSNPAVGLEVSKPAAPSDPLGLQTVREQAEHQNSPEHTVWGGVNGSFFNVATGVAQGLFYDNGIALQQPSTAYPNFFAITKDNKVLIGDAAILPDIKDNLYDAVGGGVMLLKNNILVTQTEAVPSVNPRTCIGISADGAKVYILAIDGRKYHYSNGMTYEELGQCMIALGAKDALNLDGGGSTSFVVRNNVENESGLFALRNWPSDNGGEERPVSNALLIVSH